VGKRGSIGSQGSGDHVGALGLAGDLAVTEKSPVNVVSVMRKTTLTCGTRCQWHIVSLLFFYSKSRFLALLQKSYLQFIRSKNCEVNFGMFLEMASFLIKI